MTRERVGSLIFLFFGIYGLVFSLGIPFGSWKRPGPGVFPLSLSILLSISGILWFIVGKRKGGGEKRTEWRKFIKQFTTSFQIAVATAAFILLLNRVGYLLTSTLYLLVLFLWVCRYRLWAATGLAFCLGVGSWLFFGKLLDVQLPQGLFPL